MNQQSIMVLNLVIMFFMGFMVWFFFLRNFLLSWIKVKMPMTKYNVLIEVQHAVQNYYAPGVIQKSMLYYTGKKTPDNPTPNRIVDLTEVEKKVGIGAIVTRSLGVLIIRVDDAKNCILYKDEESYKSIDGYNAEAIDELVYTALHKPSLEEGLMKPKIFQIVMVIGILILGVGLFMVYSSINKSTALLDGHLKMIYDYTYAMVNHLNVTIVPANYTGIGG